MKTSRILILGIVLVAISGCASWYDSNVETPASYNAPRSIDKDYSISGRFNIKTPEKNYYGNFNWVRESDNDSLNFVSPLGNTVAEIITVNGLATLNTDNESYSGDNLDIIMQKNLGFILPLSYLHYWIQGVPLPQFPVEKKLDSGFNQLKWQVEYLSWQDKNHPHIIQISKDTLTIKLLVDWP